MMAWVAHSLGRNGDVGVRSTAMNSSRLANPSGWESSSGRINRNSMMSPPAAPSATMESRSRVRRAGKMFTSSSVTADPATAGTTSIGTSVTTAYGANSTPPR